MSVNECSENGPNYGARAVVLLYTVVKRKKTVKGGELERNGTKEGYFEPTF